MLISSFEIAHSLSIPLEIAFVGIRNAQNRDFQGVSPFGTGVALTECQQLIESHKTHD